MKLSETIWNYGETMNFTQTLPININQELLITKTISETTQYINDIILIVAIISFCLGLLTNHVIKIIKKYYEENNNVSR